MDDNYLKPQQNLRVHQPEFSDWHCEVFGTGAEGIILTPIKGSVPCRFWRVMQYLIFGNKWIKENK